ncbi:TlpA family protein disulfide reductase [Flavisolibacter ginsenosidimutans]|uniref:Redoxin domain-containing protein n=1 Tax=Flavisolibacter ginsenosidimutans TaxID=661481 RepID=A0A5B8UKY9_9BACT|nr:redoxin domain-containing protein [Flavisolibacter ginsenosidimutans]QEC56690.1 redoxin domain-containing protein [Flavisolibacter ginsenosidimutans]
MKYTALLSLLVVTAASLFAQKTAAQEMTIGDNCRKLSIPQPVGLKAGAKTLSAFTGKPLLITFWNTHCVDATEFLPKLDTLQRTAKGRFNVLLVAVEKAAAVRKAFKEQELLKELNFPLLAGDTVLWKAFPHHMEPHIVWVSAKGTVQAITGSKQVTPKNLEAFTAGQSLSLPLKKETSDTNVFFSFTPLMVNDYERTKDKLLYYSYIGGQRSGIMSGSSGAFYDADKGVVRTHAQNLTIKHLYKLAYKNRHNFHNSRVLLPEGEETDTVLKKHYCVDIILHDTSIRKAYRCLQAELDRYFEWKSSAEMRKIRVWVIRGKPAQEALAAQKEPIEMYEQKGRLIVRGVRLPTLFQSWNLDTKTLLPVVDETGFKGTVNMELPAELKDKEALQKALKQYGLELIEEEREMEVIVVRKGD